MLHSLQFTNYNLDLDSNKLYNKIENGHKVCKLSLLKKLDLSYKKLSFNYETQQIMLSKYDISPYNSHNLNSSKKLSTLDLMLIKEIYTLDFKLNIIKNGDKWKKDKEIQRYDPKMILIISFGSSFVLNRWILLFESREECNLWCDGLKYLKNNFAKASHYFIVDRWLRKQFYGIVSYGESTITIKHMKPFVQTNLQCKVQSKQLQEITEDEMGFEAFVFAYSHLLNLNSIFSLKFLKFSDKNHIVSFDNFLKFINQFQHDEIGKSYDLASNFLRQYLRDVDLTRDILEPYLTSEEFTDYLFSMENSIFNPINKKVVQDMTKPLTHYWIASSHNTYLTGDQLISESSLEAYVRSLLMGCRCIELDCWDGPRKSSGEFSEIVIYHGYTMTSKLNLRDVLYTIKHYAFITSQYPIILSIEDNCSVQAQRQMAQDFKEILGDSLLTQPISRDEWQLPSPEALKNKIILKHKKLQLDENDSLLFQNIDDDQEQDILSLDCSKKGVLYMRNNADYTWSKYVFLLFHNRLCYILNSVENFNLFKDKFQSDDEFESVSTQDCFEDSSLSTFGISPEEMHITEEWFHGKVERDVAKDRLMEQVKSGDGVFLVRESETFIGDYTLSFLYNRKVNHCRIKTELISGEKKYYFFELIKRDTLYELISYYTKHSIDTPSFKAYLLTPCPQPQPHLNEPWFCGKIDKQRAEELLNTVKDDGAFLIRYSSSDNNVFVLSLRIDGKFLHYRLKRDGRLFVLNQINFENLNQIVEFYSHHDFVPGICLKYPINERNIELFINTESSSVESGYYIELKNLEKEIEVRSIRPFVGSSENHLSFPINAKIMVISKNNDLWQGTYKNKTGWFPSNYVQEIDQNNKTIDLLLNYGTIELVGSTFEIFKTDRLYSFRIIQSSSILNSQEFVLAAESSEEMNEWITAINLLTRTVNDKINLLRTKEKQLKIANELSSLVVYCQAVPFNIDFALQDPRKTFYEMCSFSESKHEKLLEKGLIIFNLRQLSRVYPHASRLTSSNFNPIPMWNSGCHMVALNYQTGDRSMQLNYGKFSANGQCGYVLKPQYLMDEMFKSDQTFTLNIVQNNAESVKNCSPICLTLQIIAGKHLSRKDYSKGICSPFVEVEIVGLQCDCSVERTSTITSNGLNPIWNSTFVFNILHPELALIRFLVEDGDFVGPKSDPFIGQAVFPVNCIRSGYRSVPLLNQFNEPLEISSLLVHVEIRFLNDSMVQNLHNILQSENKLKNFSIESSSVSSLPFATQSLQSNNVITSQTNFNSLNKSLLNYSKDSELLNNFNDSDINLMHSQTSSSNKSLGTISIESNDFTQSKKSSNAFRKIFKFGKI